MAAARGLFCVLGKNEEALSVRRMCKKVFRSARHAGCRPFVTQMLRGTGGFSKFFIAEVLEKWGEMV